MDRRESFIEAVSALVQKPEERLKLAEQRPRMALIVAVQLLAQQRQYVLIVTPHTVKSQHILTVLLGSPTLTTIGTSASAEIRQT